MKCPEEPDFESIRDYAKNIKIKYISAGEAAAKLGKEFFIYIQQFF